MAEPVVIGAGVCKWIKEPTTKMITLHYPTSANGTFSLHDDNNTDYQVPAGKKLVILKIQDTVGSRHTVATNTMYKNTTTDSTVGATQFYVGTGYTPYYSSSVSGSSSVFHNKDVYCEIPAGNFIVSVNAGNNGNASIIILGIETNV